MTCPRCGSRSLTAIAEPDDEGRHVHEAGGLAEMASHWSDDGMCETCFAATGTFYPTVFIVGSLRVAAEVCPACHEFLSRAEEVAS